MISAGHVGYVIGKSGESVNLVQQETGARVHIPKGQPGDQIEVVISGNDAQVEAAEARVFALLPSESTVMVKGDQLPAVLGKGGGTIRWIEEESGAKLTVPKEGRGADQVPVTISGAQDVINKAKQMISELLTFEATEQFVLDPQQVRGIIGKAGREIKELEMQTGVHASCDAEVLTVNGTAEQVAAAKQAVHALCARMQPSELELSAKSLRVMLKENENLVAVAEQTGARVQVPWRQLKQAGSDATVTLSVTGAAEQVRQAQEMLNQMLSDTQAKYGQYNQAKSGVQVKMAVQSHEVTTPCLTGWVTDWLAGWVTD